MNIGGSSSIGPVWTTGYGTMWHVVTAERDYRRAHTIWCADPECRPIPKPERHATTDCGLALARSERVIPEPLCRNCTGANVAAGRLQAG